MANKNIILHPIVDGVQDDSTNLYPQTTKNNIIDLTVDATPTDGSANPVQSGGVYTALAGKSAVVANPVLAGTEASLTGVEVDGTKYKVEQPTTVVANPTLVGTEADLTGLQVGSTKYKIPSGGSYSAGSGISISSNTISVKGLPYTTTAPSSANLDGTLHVVVLSAEPGTTYNGYLYIIT